LTSNSDDEKKGPRILPTQHIVARRFAASLVFIEEGGIGPIKFFKVIFG
jgi:hypothetical protein